MNIKFGNFTKTTNINLNDELENKALTYFISAFLKYHSRSKNFVSIDQQPTKRKARFLNT